MKLGKNIVELALEISRQQAAKRDFIAPTSKLALLDDGKTLAADSGNGGEFQINDIALQQIASHTNVPLAYVRRMQADAPKLLASNVNHWFNANPQRRMVRTLDTRARAFLSDRYARIDHHDVAEVVLPVLSKVPGMRIVSTEVTERKLYIKAVSTEIRGEVHGRRVGDMVEAGVVISNSEVGLGAVNVSPFALFLVCLNGMKREGGRRWAHIGKQADERDEIYAMLTDETRHADDKALLLKVRDTVSGALDPARFQKWIGSLQETTERDMGAKVERGIEVLGATIGLSSGEQDSVLRHLITGGDLSQYGLINAVTRTAEDAESYDRASELEAAGQSVLELSPTEWRNIREAA